MDNDNKFLKTYASFMGGWMAGSVISHIIIKIATVVGILWLAHHLWCN